MSILTQSTTLVSFAIINSPALPLLGYSSVLQIRNYILKIVLLIIMGKLVLIILILSIITAGCTTNEVDQKQPDYLKNYTTSDSKEEISIWLPDWEEVGSDDPNNNLTLTNEQCSVGINVIDFPPEFYEKAVEDYIIENDGTILSRSPLSYTITSGKYTFKTQTKAIFCDDKTYFVYYTFRGPV